MREEYLVGRNTYDRRQYVAADKIPGLGQRASDGPVDKHGRSPKRSDDHEQVRSLKEIEVNGSHSGHPDKGPNPRPDNL